MPTLAALPDRYTERDSLLVPALTAGILFLGGLARVYQLHLGEHYRNYFSLTPPEWVAYTVGPFLVEPVLLFGVLYYVGSRREVSLSVLVPPLVVAVVAGTLLGQYVGLGQWSTPSGTGEILAVQALSNLYVPHPSILEGWRILIEPLVRDLLTAVAALALAGRSS